MDAAVFVIGLLLLLHLGLRLRVYNQVTVVEVTVEQVIPDRTRVDIPTPAELTRPGRGAWPGEQVVPRADALIEDLMPRWPIARQAPAGTRFDFTVRRSEGSTDLDHVRRLSWMTPHGDD